MKKLLLLFVLATLAVGTPSRGQVLSASTPLTLDSNVINGGSTALAISVNAFLVDNFAFPGNSSDTVHGVTFTGSLNQGINLSYTGFFNSFANGVNTGAGLSAGFNDALRTGLFDDPGPATITLYGLTKGNTYLLQLFAGRTDVSGTENIADGLSSTTLTFGSGGTDVGYITDVFTAVTTSETVTFTSGTGAPLISAANVRNLGVVPEPSTSALMLIGGLIVVGLTIRRRVRAEVRLQNR